ncbi:hypothetical protein CONLIGDRAFT_646052 [Coniochaeta ligniaria NRRL 30616]|uniref:Uncharacterized protein n=1 Tax=Coniochaeta ligniaria NRRL 30616 TaxID=1408157 RepID=A0A1J7JEZ5_9PEZI|nr:hypothetical protein CONLIGDRAFT_646052 [Coniochaeta ligniaria NRRL 30616]
MTRPTSKNQAKVKQAKATEKQEPSGLALQIYPRDSSPIATCQSNLPPAFFSHIGQVGDAGLAGPAGPAGFQVPFSTWQHLATGIGRRWSTSNCWSIYYGMMVNALEFGKQWTGVRASAPQLPAMGVKLWLATTMKELLIPMQHFQQNTRMRY